MNYILGILKEWLPLFSDVTVIAATIIASYVGLKGLNTWRHQLKGNTEYELAKQFLRSVYELREAISIVRHPFMQYSQEPDMPKEELNGLSQREKEWHGLVQAYQKRWDRVPKAVSVLGMALLEGEVVWGSSIVEKAAPLTVLINELLGAIQGHIEAMNPKTPNESPAQGEIKKRRDIIFARGAGDKDEYKIRLEEVIANLEKELKPHIVQYHGKQNAAVEV